MRVIDDSTSYQRVLSTGWEADSGSETEEEDEAIIQGTGDLQILFMTHDSLNDLTVKELKAICQKFGIKSGKRKADNRKHCQKFCFS